MLFFIVFSLLVSPLSFAEVTCHSPADAEAILLQNADLQLQELNQEIELFLSQKTKLLKENEAFLKELKKWEEELENHANFTKKLQQLQGDFLAFRQSLSDVVYDNHGQCSYSRSLRVCSIHQITDWYANHIREMLFPTTLKCAEIDQSKP